jgi:hypothetical protein
VGNARNEGGQRKLSRREAIEAGVALATAVVLPGVPGCSPHQPSGQASDGGSSGTLPPATAGAHDWPQWQGPDRNAISKEKGLLQEWPKDGPPLAWTAKGLGGGDSAPSVTGGGIFGMSSRGVRPDPPALGVEETPWIVARWRRCGRSPALDLHARPIASVRGASTARVSTARTDPIMW